MSMCVPLKYLTVREMARQKCIIIIIRIIIIRIIIISIIRIIIIIIRIIIIIIIIIRIIIISGSSSGSDIGKVK